MKIIGTYITFCLICLSFGSYAQKIPDILSEKGYFKISYTKGCPPLRVDVVGDYPGQIDGIYSYQYDPNEVFVSQEHHVYTEPGVYEVKQVFNAVIGGIKTPMEDRIIVNVFPAAAPDFKVILCNNHRATVDITPDNYDFYRIFFSNSDYANNIYYEVPAGDDPPIHQYVGPTNDVIRIQGLFDDKGTSAQCNSTSSNSVSTLNQINQPELRIVEVLDIDESEGEVRLSVNVQTNVFYKIEYSEEGSGVYQEYDRLFKNENNPIVRNLDTQNKYYCFRITPIDGCNTGLSSSNVICSIKLDATASSNQNQLTWNNLIGQTTPFPYIDVFLDDSPIGSSDSNTTFVDGDVDCGREYSYHIMATNGSGLFSISGKQQLIGIKNYNPPAIENVLASYDLQGNISLTWQPPPGFVNVDEYTIVQVGGNKTWATTAANLEVEASKTTPSCYSVNYMDDCGNVSEEGHMVCPLFITVVQESGQQKLVWSSYVGWDNGIDHYVLEKRDGNGNLIEEIEISIFENEYIETPGQDHQVIYYRILAITNDFQPFTLYSNQIRVSLSGDFYFPSAFTPDGDTVNDTFKVIGQYLKEYEIVIYNKWGELVFSTTNPTEGWDGTYRNKEAPQGVYVYSAVIVDYEGKKYLRTGSVHLLRK